MTMITGMDRERNGKENHMTFGMEQFLLERNGFVQVMERIGTDTIVEQHAQFGTELANC